MIRRAALASVLLLALSTAAVSAGEPPVVQMVGTSSFNPAQLQVPVGGGVIWDNDSGFTHTTTANKFGFWNRAVSPGAETQVAMSRSGTWAYLCTIHPNMTGKIKVRPTASPLSGTTATNFVIRYASVNPSSGFVQDIQRRKGSNPFKQWRYGLSAQTTNWMPASAGTWQFRARYRKTSNGATTGWSQPLTVVVN